jgi:hypothetical protein
MVLKRLMNLFGGGQNASSSFTAGKTPEGIRDLEHFVDYIVRALVDYPDQVKVSVDEQEDNSVIRIECDKDDIGKIVGKKGKTIMGIRALVSGAAGRLQRKVSVEVID